MNISKAVITAAGPGQEQLPLQTLINRRGEPCSTLAVQLAELANSGIEEVAVVINDPERETLLRHAAQGTDLSLVFVKQPAEAKGFGHAILSAAEFTAGQPFLLMVGDHIYVSDDSSRTCASQLIEVARRENCVISAVQSTHESQLRQFGTIGGSLVAGQAGLYEVNQVEEKPTPTYAEQHLLVPGQRLAHYLCFFGMHVLTPEVLELLRKEAAQLHPEQALGLSPALHQFAGLGKYLAAQLQGRRFDLEPPYGLLKAQIAIGLQGTDRERVLTEILELFAPLRSDA
ncbi:MAG: sugar phosphate nucleotidyltransferase [Opitutales bacterium]